MSIRCSVNQNPLGIYLCRSLVESSRPRPRLVFLLFRCSMLDVGCSMFVFASPRNLDITPWHLDALRMEPSLVTTLCLLQRSLSQSCCSSLCERSEPETKSRRDDLTIAQGKRGPSAALGTPSPRLISLSSCGGEGWGEEAVRNNEPAQSTGRGESWMPTVRGE